MSSPFFLPRVTSYSCPADRKGNAQGHSRRAVTLSLVHVRISTPQDSVHVRFSDVTGLGHLARCTSRCQSELESTGINTRRVLVTALIAHGKNSDAVSDCETRCTGSFRSCVDGREHRLRRFLWLQLIEWKWQWGQRRQRWRWYG